MIAETKRMNNKNVTCLISILESQLTQLGWNWESPRVQNYLITVATVLRGNYKSIEEIPEKYLITLGQLLTLYEQCSQMIILLNLTWDDPIVLKIFNKFPYGNRMPLRGWEELYESLETEWFVNGSF